MQEISGIVFIPYTRKSQLVYSEGVKIGEVFESYVVPGFWLALYGSSYDFLIDNEYIARFSTKLLAAEFLLKIQKLNNLI
jgi:hypothetical protein